MVEDYRFFHLSDKSDTLYDYHYHDFYKLIFFIKGNVHYIIEGKNYELKPRDIIVVPKNLIHKPEVDPHEEYDRIVMYFSDAFLNQKIESGKKLIDIFNEASNRKSFVFSLSAVEDTKLQNDLNKLEKKLSQREYGTSLYSRLLITEILLYLNESVYKNGISFSEDASYNEKIIAITDYINENLSKDLSVDEIAGKFYISKYYLMRRFKECTGFSLHKYIIEKRVLYAKELTKKGMKVTAACKEAGFKDYSTYTRALKRVYKAEIEA